jgi:hypothetical protein
VSQWYNVSNVRPSTWIGPLAWAALAAAVACDKSPNVVSRTVTTHFSSRCALPADGYAIYYAFGDYQPTTDAPAIDKRFLSDTGAVLAGLPPAARSLVLDVSDARGDGRWLGVGAVPAEGAVDVMLWPASAPCALRAPLGRADSQAFGAVDATHLLVVGGRSADLSLPRSFLVDLSRASLTELPAGPLTPRARAAITPYAGGGLLSGGVRADDPNGLLATAEVWDRARGDFDGQSIALSTPRADHAAVQLASGDVLLVGGTGPTGPLRTLELVSATERRALSGGLPLLERARVRPFALRLSSGEILVAGGTDGTGAPVPDVEVLAPDARSVVRRSPLVARARHAFVALGGGGALAVIAPDATDPPDFQSVWRISDAGAVTTIAPPTAALGEVHLVPGTQGGALLWTGERWLELDPWSERFVLPRLSTSGEGGPAAGAPVTSAEPGLPTWIDARGAEPLLVGRRFAVRHAYTTDSTSYLELPSAASGTTTELLAPDRSPRVSGLRFGDRGLELPEAATAWIADALFGDFASDVEIEGSARLVVRGVSGRELAIGGAECLVSGAAPGTLHVERDGARVSARIGNGPGTTCTLPFPAEERASLGVRGGPALARSWHVTRR